MKFSKETLIILKNYADINGNILFRPGSVIVTGSPVGDTYASATIPETIPVEFGIYDLNKFLASISLFKDPVLVFDDDNYVTIQGNNGSSLRYVFCEPHTLIVPPEEMSEDLPDLEEWFEINSETLDAVLKAARTLQVKDICLVSDGKEVNLVAIDLSNPSSDKYSNKIGISANNFSINFPVEVLRLLPGNYQVGISKTGISNWKNTQYPISYWIASSTTSTFE